MCSEIEKWKIGSFWKFSEFTLQVAAGCACPCPLPAHAISWGSSGRTSPPAVGWHNLRWSGNGFEWSDSMEICGDMWCLFQKSTWPFWVNKGMHNFITCLQYAKQGLFKFKLMADLPESRLDFGRRPWLSKKLFKCRMCIASNHESVAKADHTPRNSVSFGPTKYPCYITVGYKVQYSLRLKRAEEQKDHEKLIILTSVPHTHTTKKQLPEGASCGFPACIRQRDKPTLNR